MTRFGWWVRKCSARHTEQLGAHCNIPTRDHAVVAAVFCHVSSAACTPVDLSPGGTSIPPDQSSTFTTTGIPLGNLPDPFNVPTTYGRGSRPGGCLEATTLIFVWRLEPATFARTVTVDTCGADANMDTLLYAREALSGKWLPSTTQHSTA